MRHVYHLPEPGRGTGADPHVQARVVLAVEAAVIRGVTEAVRGLTAGPGQVVPLARPPARRRADASGDDAHPTRRIEVPSYGDHGRAVSIPVSVQPAAPHPAVAGYNRLSELVAQAGRTPLPSPIVAAPPGSGVFGRMWHRGVAEDTQRLLRPRPGEDDLRRGEAILEEAVAGTALELARTLLDRSETVARRELGRYGEPAATVPGSPAVRLRAAARELATLQRQILDHVRDFGNAQAAAVPGAPQAGAPLDAGRFDDWLSGSIARSDTHVQRVLLPRYETLKRIYGEEFPILLGHNLDLSRFAVADPAALAAAVAATTTEVLGSIAELRTKLNGDSVWQLDELIAAARYVMGVELGTPAAIALDRYLAERSRDELLRQLLLTAFGVVLAIGATVATAGAAAPGAAAGLALLAGGLSLGAAGVSVYGVVEQYQDYAFRRAAAHSALDATTALAREDPSLAWLVVGVVGAVVDVGAAALAVRNLASLARAAVAARDLGAFEQAVRAQARVLAAEGRLNGTEEEFVRTMLRLARTRIGGTAAEPLRVGGLVFSINPDGQTRTLAQAVALAERHGVHIDDDILIRVDATLKPDVFARYGNEVKATDRVDWNRLTNNMLAPRPGYLPSYWVSEPIEDSRRVMQVWIRPDVLQSDEAIVGVLAHEMHEINWLRTALEGGAGMPASRFHGLVNGQSGSLHLEAWRVAGDLVRRMRDL